MRAFCVGSFLAVAIGCGPSLTPEPVKTPEERLAEQERLQAEAEREAQFKERGEVDTKEIDEESKKKFDQRQAEIELKRAARSAESCALGVVGPGEKEQPKGEAEVSLVFGNDGHVKSASIAPPFEGTKVGKCALRAMGAVIVPPFVGPEQPVTWKVDLTGSKGAEAQGKKEEKEEMKK